MIVFSYRGTYCHNQKRHQCGIDQVDNLKVQPVFFSNIFILLCHFYFTFWSSQTKKERILLIILSFDHKGTNLYVTYYPTEYDSENAKP